jgi:hypothetical protein
MGSISTPAWIRKMVEELESNGSFDGSLAAYEQASSRLNEGLISDRTVTAQTCCRRHRGQIGAGLVAEEHGHPKPLQNTALDGRDGEIRTPDPLLPKEVLGVRGRSPVSENVCL